MKNTILFLICLFGIWGISCDPARRAGTPTRPGTPGKPAPGKSTPMDTIRWTPSNSGKPPIGQGGNQPGSNKPNGATYHIAYLLPFLSNQMEGEEVPEKSKLALQFYAGGKLALEQLSAETSIQLVVNVWDTQANDTDFEKVMNNSRLDKSTVFIGPVRASHVSTFASWTKQRGKILVSPETPSADLTQGNPGFVQINPSLRAHCETITQYVRKRNKADAVTLVCKEKEADRMIYFQQANARMGGTTRLNELVIPDDQKGFEQTDLRKYLRAGRTSVFVLPSWASQDYIMAFLRKLKEVKGSHQVEVYGMPQWRHFDAIEPEYLSQLNVHITSAGWQDYTDPDIKAFQQKFYESTGTLPDDDAFNGYDVTLFVGRMLAKYGLSFPEHLGSEKANTLRGRFAFSQIFTNGGVDQGNNQPDYWENTFVHLLRFDQFRYVPVE
ncbi:MAG: hypothetical protein JNN28_07135 [Saprospiraceae bacterium]|nr:hypothetical protein [Saprospiraceae bacterium]